MGGLGSFIQSGIALGAQLASQRQAAQQLQQQADATEAASSLQAAQRRDRYARDSKSLARQQRAEASLARVRAMKHGAQGASQTAVAAARAAQAQEAQSDLFLNAAMDTGAQAVAAGQRSAQLREQARQQDAAFNRTLWAGLGSMAPTRLPTLSGSEMPGVWR